MGEWAIREACHQIRIWQDSELGSVRLAVNISAQPLHRCDVANVVGDILQEFGLHPSLLQLELTEMVVMRDAERSIRALRRLTDLGVTISLDDFGTGFSSLSYLRKLPLNELKIDRSLVRELGSGSGSGSGADRIVGAIVALAHSLNLRVAAEGVESIDQWRFLQGIGCDKYQGYLCSPALPAAEFASLAIESRAASAVWTTPRIVASVA